jgi:hypothetical protein
MSDKTKTKAGLLEMLAEAVRNTQPQPVGNTQPEPARDAQPERKRKTQSRKTGPASQRTAKTKNVQASASRKQRRR